MFIKYLTEGKRIINIDESNVEETDARKRGWYFPRKKNQQTRNSRINAVNIIAGVSNLGDFMYTVNSGKTETDTFFLFLMKVMRQLSVENINWRDETIIMLDNAAYHRSQINLERFKKYKVPVLFLGPYHFKLAPMELMFSYIKNRNLNPLNSRATSK